MKATTQQISRVATTAAMLAADAVQKANSGHPGAPMGMADFLATLFVNHLRFDPNDPAWVGRDRFVLSNGHGCAIQYALLHLFGLLDLEELKNFRQLGSKTPGHPEYGHTPFVEATTGPLGQGVANAVGMAIAAKNLQAKAGEGGKPLFGEQRIWCVVGDGCLMEGISYEALSLAGHFGLNNLILIMDSNSITIDGATSLTNSEDVAARFRAIGFEVIEIDGHNIDQVDAAYLQAKAATRPTLIVAKTTIGKGAPKKAGTSSAHGEPLGTTELGATKVALGWPEESFHVPDDIALPIAGRRAEMRESRNSWDTAWKAFENTDAGRQLAMQFDDAYSMEWPSDLIEAIPDPTKSVASRKMSEAMLGVAMKLFPGLLGGSADLAPSNLTRTPGVSDFTAADPLGRYLRFGVREHAMAAIVNGITLYGGGYRAFGATFLQFMQYMLPSIRLAALSKIGSIFIFTHDSIGVGEDGPTHQPIEHLMQLRAIPNLHVIRPCNGLEMAAAYYAAMQRQDGPTVIICSRQNLDPVAYPSGLTVENGTKPNIVWGSSGPNPLELVVVATGSEVPLAVAAAKQFPEGMLRVISMPCCEEFRSLGLKGQKALIPPGIRVVVVEAGQTLGWRDILAGHTVDDIVGIETFGASAPAPKLWEKFGFTQERLAARLQAAIGAV